MNIPKFYSIEDIQREYDRTSQGHWFDRDTMRFFKTRLTSNFRILSDREYLFVTTEANWNGDRRASVRKCTVRPDKSRFCGFKIDIDTVGEFHSMSLYEAKKAMNNYNKGGNE